jgi:putative polyhydroxyalkanoate system protein
MADIHIERQHDKGIVEIRRRLVRFESKLHDRLGVVLNWTGDVACFDASGVSGRLAVYENLVSIDIKLGTLIRPLEPAIREKLESGIDSALA